MTPSGNGEQQTIELLKPSTNGGLTPRQTAPLELAASDPQGKHSNILVVDDNEELRKTIVLKLELFGYSHVRDVGDGEAALAAIREREYDLMILDIQMPKLDGFGVLTALKNDPAL